MAIERNNTNNLTWFYTDHLNCMKKVYNLESDLSLIHVNSITETLEKNCSLESVSLPFDLWKIILITLVIGILSLFTVGSNILVLLTFIMHKSIRHPSNYFIASLASSDILIGLFSMPFYAYYVLIGYWNIRPLLCELYLSVDYAICLISQCTIILITIDRFISIKMPIQHRLWCTRNVVGWILIIKWILPISIFSWKYFTRYRKRFISGQCIKQFLKDPMFSSTLLVGYHWITLSILFILNGCIFKTLYYMQKKSKAKKKKMQSILTLNNSASHCKVKHSLSMDPIRSTTNFSNSITTLKSEVTNSETARPELLKKISNSSMCCVKVLTSLETMTAETDKLRDFHNLSASPIRQIHTNCTNSSESDEHCQNPILNAQTFNQQSQKDVISESSSISHSSTFDVSPFCGHYLAVESHRLQDITKCLNETNNILMRSYESSDSSKSSSSVRPLTISSSPSLDRNMNCHREVSINITPLRQTKIMGSNQETLKMNNSDSTCQNSIITKISPFVLYKNLEEILRKKVAVPNQPDRSTCTSIPPSMNNELSGSLYPSIHNSSRYLSSTFSNNILKHQQHHKKKQLLKYKTSMNFSVLNKYSQCNLAQTTSLRRNMQKKSYFAKNKLCFKRTGKAFRTIILIFGTFVIFSTPYNIIVLIKNLCDDPSCINNQVFIISYFLPYVKSLINPVCYAFLNPIFQKSITKMFNGDFSLV